ncbi:MAG: isocitrate lyase/phosphoenolpyruvate mutase family protein [Alphaproteobacteria bacterium]|nr:isocitrate lyase/PEP mutase family protein [Alphaproteobacteria bacterium]MDE2111364.1 isocitrate lyase/phosphoenolpyruvate mutase family protein [Alphaproteobacteria bacterium]MDE2495583.1 isocitrate lyase/phosphoenolpyruvate mutase family protein [Alphaproteobacteria bacterium]
MSGNDKLFRALHAGPELLILPNAWDAGSARVIESAGAKAIATSSAAVAWAHGYPDGEFLPFDTVIAVLREIARAVRVPVTADIEGGYAESAGEIDERIAQVVGAGAVGVNIEDGTGTPDLLCAKIERAKSAAARAGVDLWVNARTDVYLRSLARGEAAFVETLHRASHYRSAGADSIFVPALVDERTIARLVPELGLPLNLLAWSGLPDAQHLRRLGVRRLSAGAGVGKIALNRIYVLARAFLEEGKAEVLNDPPPELTNLNDMMRRG